jgi:hypothetical protein
MEGNIANAGEIAPTHKSPSAPLSARSRRLRVLYRKQVAERFSSFGDPSESRPRPRARGSTYRARNGTADGISRLPAKLRPKAVTIRAVRRDSRPVSVRYPAARSARPTAPTNPIAAGRAKCAKRAISDRTRRNRLREQRPTSRPRELAHSWSWRWWAANASGCFVRSAAGAA